MDNRRVRNRAVGSTAGTVGSGYWQLSYISHIIYQIIHLKDKNCSPRKSLDAKSTSYPVATLVHLDQEIIGMCAKIINLVQEIIALGPKIIAMGPTKQFPDAIQ